MNDSVKTHSRRHTFFWVLLVFFAPLLLAFFIYYGTNWHPTRMSNKGDLISPVISLPDVALTTPDDALLNARWLQGKWTLLYVGDGVCDQSCRDTLRTTRTIRLLLGKDSARVQRAFLYAGHCCDQPYFSVEQPDLVIARIDNVAGTALLKLLPRDAGDPLQARRAYIVDPLGNLMMSYKPGADARDLLEDLKKLLSLSHIG